MNLYFVEFRPGEPWQGYPNIDPETDPFVTPGSVINNLSINTVRDVDHLRDRNNGKHKLLKIEKCCRKMSSQIHYTPILMYIMRIDRLIA